MGDKAEEVRGVQDLSLGEIIAARKETLSFHRKAKKAKAPRHPQSARHFFRLAALDAVARELGPVEPGVLIAKLDERFDGLSPDDRQAYIIQEMADQTRYSRELSAYERKQQKMRGMKRARPDPAAPAAAASPSTPEKPGHGRKAKQLPEPSSSSTVRARPSTSADEPPAKRQKRDPLSPEPALQAYTWFVATQRPFLMKNNPGLSFRRVAKVLGEAWRGLSESGKWRYRVLAVVDAKRHSEQLVAMKAPTPTTSASSTTKLAGPPSTAIQLFAQERRIHAADLRALTAQWETLRPGEAARFQSLARAQLAEFVSTSCGPSHVQWSAKRRATAHAQVVAFGPHQVADLLRGLGGGLQLLPAARVLEYGVDMDLLLNMDSTALTTVLGAGLPQQALLKATLEIVTR